MPPIRKSQSSSTREHDLVNTLGVGNLVMRPCRNCVSGRKDCRIGSESDKCIACVRSGAKCDLSFSTTEWKKIRGERDRVLAELKETLARAARLQKQFEFLEAREQEMVDREFRNIAELEEDERQQATEPLIDDLLFDVSSEQIALPPLDNKLPTTTPIPSPT